MLNACCSYPEVIDADRFLLPLLRLGADDFLTLVQRLPFGGRACRVSSAKGEERQYQVVPW